MVLSNAQRQKAYREKLKAIARGDMIGEQVQGALIKALEVFWSQEGRDKTYDFDSLSDLQSYYAANLKQFELAVRDQSEYLDELSEDEADAIKTAVKIFDALALRV